MKGVRGKKLEVRNQKLGISELLSQFAEVREGLTQVLYVYSPFL